jgi:hypothetical protein
VPPPDSAEIPPAPWPSVVDAVLWLHPATPAATLPAQRASRAGLPITIGGLIPYRDGPERAISVPRSCCAARATEPRLVVG